jgi:hypothetical protein
VASRRLELVDIERKRRCAAPDIVERVLLDDAGSGDPKPIPRIPGRPARSDQQLRVLIERDGKPESTAKIADAAHLKLRVSARGPAAPAVIAIRRSRVRLLLTRVVEPGKPVALESRVDNRKLIAEMALGVALDRKTNVVRGDDLLATIPAVGFQVVRT